MFDGLHRFLRTESIGVFWYWALLAVVWSLATRGVLGVPSEVILRARSALRAQARAEAADKTRPAIPAEPPRDALLLLDWLSLTLPRLRLSRGESVFMAAVGGFLLAVLATLGFVYRLELALALSLILLPLSALLVTRLMLAQRLAGVLGRARRGELPAAAAAETAARAMIRARWVAVGLSFVSVGTIPAVAGVAGLAIWLYY